MLKIDELPERARRMAGYAPGTVPIPPVRENYPDTTQGRARYILARTQYIRFALLLGEEPTCPPLFELTSR